MMGLDYFLDIGASIYQLQRFMLLRGDLEVRLNEGRLSMGYAKEEPLFYIGIRGIELTADDWQRAVEQVALLPVREQVRA